MHTKWIVPGLTDTVSGCGDKHKYRATWAEILVLFILQTGYQFDNATLDFASQERLIKSMFTALASKSKFKLHGRTCRAHLVWHGGPCITSALSVLGHTRAGVCRRPIATTQTWQKVVEVLEHILTSSTCKADYGKGTRVPTYVRQMTSHHGSPHPPGNSCVP